MKSNVCAMFLFVVVGFPLSATAQINGVAFAAELRAKYGPPLARETFAVRPGVEMVVDFVANGHVCRIQLPGVAPGSEPTVKTAQAVDEIVDELVPMAARGKERSRFHEATGAPSVSQTFYEDVTITKSFQGSRPTGVTILFPKEQCGGSR